jgi:hypothetical protein
MESEGNRDYRQYEKNISIPGPILLGSAADPDQWEKRGL